MLSKGFSRKGIATVELVMVLIVIIPMTFALFQVASFYLDYIHSIKDARRDAFAQRFKDPESVSFHFTDLNKQEGLSSHLGRPNRLVAKATILSGSWDFHSLPLDKPNHLEPARNIATALGEQAFDFSGVLDRISKVFDELKNLNLDDLLKKVTAKEDSGKPDLDKIKKELKETLDKLVKSLSDGDIGGFLDNADPTKLAEKLLLDTILNNILD